MVAITEAAACVCCSKNWLSTTNNQQAVMHTTSTCQMFQCNSFMGAKNLVTNKTQA